MKTYPDPVGRVPLFATLATYRESGVRHPVGMSPQERNKSRWHEEGNDYTFAIPYLQDLQSQASSPCAFDRLLVFLIIVIVLFVLRYLEQSLLHERLVASSLARHLIEQHE